MKTTVNVIAWTGHRPKDLPRDLTYQRLAAVLDKLNVGQREDLMFVTGGALGVDTMAAEYAISRDIPLHIILPFEPEVMTNRWNPHQQQTLVRHIQMADEVTIIGGNKYDIEMYQARNIAMVDRATVVFTLWTGKRNGGTANCLRYAAEVEKPAYNLLPLDGKLHRVRL
jgi:uncharacterized phage-like protein YoqJ